MMSHFMYSVGTVVVIILHVAQLHVISWSSIRGGGGGNLLKCWFDLQRALHASNQYILCFYFLHSVKTVFTAFPLQPLKGFEFSLVRAFMV